MKMCLSEGMKRIKELEKRKEALLFNETRRMCVSYREGETPAAADYDYAATRAAVSKIDDEVRAIRTAISRANCTAEAEEGCTIGEALVLVAQLNARAERLNMLASREKLMRRITQTGVLEYTECSYDPEQAVKDAEKINSRIYRLQLAIDRANLNTYIEV